MASLTPLPGNWNVLGFNLPDFGITELVSPTFGNWSKTPTSGPNAPLDYSNPANVALQKDRAAAGPNATPNYSNLITELKQQGAEQKDVINQNSWLDTLINVNGVNKTRRSAMAEGLMDNQGNIIKKSTSPSGTTGGSTTKLGNDQLDQIVNVNGVNKTRRSAIAENLMDEFGNLFPTPTYTGPSDQDLNSAYAPLFDVLSQAEKMLGTNYGTQKTNIEGQVATAKQLADEQKRVAGETIAQNDLLGAKRKEDVISSARKLFQELQIGNQQRFGGASSAGQAASELQGREFMSLSGKAQQGYSDLVKELNAKKLEVDNNYTLALQQLEDKKAAALADAQNNFQNALLQITQQKAGLESEKMQRKLSALETYKNQVQAVQQQQAQFAQQLQAAKYQSDLQIENYAQQLALSKQGANQSLQNYISDPTLSAVLSPTTKNQISNTYSGGFNQINPELLKQLQGMVAGQTRRDDELYGGLTPGLSSIQSLAR